MKKPGVVLKRPVGSDGPFGEHVGLPADFGDSGGRATKAARKSQARKPKKGASRSVDKAAEREAAFSYEQEQKKRDRERAREENARQKQRERQ
jgi:hypothetical protein